MPKVARVAALCLIVGVPLMAAGQDQRLSGTITYREPVKLAPTAVVEVRLEDVTRAETAPPLVARTRLERPGQVPIRFELPFDARAIDPRGRYALRATISDAGVVLFASLDTALVLTQGHGTRADLVLTQIGRAAPAVQEPAAPPLPANPLPNLPATFVGTLPCADCPGIRYQLNLFPDDSFFLRMTYIGRPVEPLDHIGSWALSSDRRVLVLKGRGDQVEMFEASAPGRLRKLDADGRPIASRLPYDLTRASTFRPLEVRVTVRGAYSSVAEAGRLVECTTGQHWLVAPGSAAGELESAYAAARLAPGGSVLAEVEGLVTERPSTVGAGTETVLVVEKVGRMAPRESCEPRFTSAPLTGTYWRLTNLGDRAIPAAGDPRREPSLTFEAPTAEAPGAYSGSTGCNRLIGTYVVANATMALTGTGTLTACKDDAALEAALIAALKATRTYRIAGRTLELIDASGARLAQFVGDGSSMHRIWGQVSRRDRNQSAALR